MKKTLIACMLATAVAAPATADTVLGLYVGAQAWNMETEGGFAANEALADFNFEDETNSSFYAALEHPIPLVPNVKIARTTLDTAGVTTLSGTFTFGDEVFVQNSRLTTTADLTTTDLILYYEILDNDLISLDIGISGKQVDGDIVVTDADTQQTSMESFDEIIPMAYGRVAVGLPLTGLGAYAEGNFLSIDDNTFTDYQAAITYNFIESLAIDMTIQAGYRVTSLELEDLDDIYADLEFEGAFIGLEFHF
uniref:TIGR04219 family outer membrane beta-barrel protein n=1 Tax=Ningiella ruwaisensis TaxID=2364274 RepID=UPI0010A04F21|nr:TIGR04219 family outer membrane beta-barrel protein [Ningiella ruwaisensis]